MEIESTSEALFEKIRSRFENVSVGDAKAKDTLDPKKARFFNFNYIDKQGNDFGNVEIDITDEQTLAVTYGLNLTKELNKEQQVEWYDFLRELRMFAMRNLLKFSPHDISRDSDPKKKKSIVSQRAREAKSTAVAPVAVNDSTVTENKLYGTTKTSYYTIAPGTRIVIRHSGPVDESIHGARSRKIQSVYIEDIHGQRLKSPVTHLGGCKALGRHIANEGQIGDDFSNHIVELVQEMAKVKRFIQGSRNKTFEDHEANDMVSAAKHRYQNIHRILGNLSHSKGYKFYKEQWEPSSLQDDADIESLRNKFVQKNFDSRLEDALPYVNRAYQSMKRESAADLDLAKFSESMDQIAEGTWALPDSDLKIKHLQELMSDVIAAGIDGNDATAALYDIIGDDKLADMIYDASQGSPEMDIRPIVYDWLMSNMPDVGKKIEASLQNGSAEPEQPEQPEQDPNQPEQQPTESVVREGEFHSVYYSVEGDSAPFYLHTGKFLDSAHKALRIAQEKGRSDVKIYKIGLINGKKVKTPIEPEQRPAVAQNTTESTHLTDLRRLAGI